MSCSSQDRLFPSGLIAGWAQPQEVCYTVDARRGGFLKHLSLVARNGRRIVAG